MRLPIPKPPPRHPSTSASRGTGAGYGCGGLMQAVILAAGMGTRLRPVTTNRSKAMVPVLGRPLVERALLPFYENGVRDFVFVVSPDDSEITRHFTKGTLARYHVLDSSSRRSGSVRLMPSGSQPRSSRAVSRCRRVTACWIRRTFGSSPRCEGDDPDAVLSLLDVGPDMVSRSGAWNLDGVTGSAYRRKAESRECAVKHGEPPSLRFFSAVAGPPPVGSSRHLAGSTNSRMRSRG